MARPSSFSPELAERICMRIAEGRSVRQACAADGLPDWRTVMRWLASVDPVDPDRPEGEPGPFGAFRQQYARAIQLRADGRFESLDHVLHLLRKGKMDAATARIHLDAIKWQTAKEHPKKYGEAVTLKGDRDNPVELRRTPRDLSDEELAILAQGGLRGAT